MSKRGSARRNVDPRPTPLPMWAWGAGAAPVERREAEHRRWHDLAHGQVVLSPVDGPQVVVGPMLGHGGYQHRPFLLRCAGCGTGVAEVWTVDREWQGRPFTWAESAWITDREARPPRIMRYSMLLDDLTAGDLVATECPEHGVVGVKVRDLLDALLGAIERVRGTGTSTKITAEPLG